MSRGSSSWCMWSCRRRRLVVHRSGGGVADAGHRGAHRLRRPTAAASYRTVAVSVAKFTLQSSTPGTAAIAFSTRAAQDAHDIPPMGRSTRSVGVRPGLRCGAHRRYLLVSEGTIPPLGIFVQHRIIPDREGLTVRGYTLQKDDYGRRLARIEGQVRGLARMIDEDQYCIDVLTQIASVTKALQNVGLGLLDQHLRHCVMEAAGPGVRAPRSSTRRCTPSSGCYGSDGGDPGHGGGGPAGSLVGWPGLGAPAAEVPAGVHGAAGGAALGGAAGVHGAAGGALGANGCGGAPAAAIASQAECCAARDRPHDEDREDRGRRASPPSRSRTPRCGRRSDDAS